MPVNTIRSRPLPENRRYLPPPESLGAGKQLKKRMREEVILTLLKTDERPNRPKLSETLLAR